MGALFQDELVDGTVGLNIILTLTLKLVSCKGVCEEKT
jgi:hypothetical protein